MLDIQSISKSFYGNCVLDNVSFQVHSGEVHALLGENGAGKSTIIKILSGIYMKDKGKVYLDGEKFLATSYKEARDFGISTVFQEFSLIPYMTVWQNVFLGKEILHKTGLFNVSEMKSKTKDLLKEINITIDIEKKIHHLSIADKQFIEIIKALSSSARVLILDEPTSTLTPDSVECLFKVVEQLKQQGIHILFISHHLEEILKFCDKVSVLRDGVLVDTVVVDDNLSKEKLIAMMIGREAELMFPPKVRPQEKVICSIYKQKSNKDKVLDLKEKEILGVFGLVGAGRTELLEETVGLRKNTNFQLERNGQRQQAKIFEQAFKAGFGFLPEDRKHNGILRDFSVVQNATINNCEGVFLVNLKKEEKKIQRTIDRIRLKYTNGKQKIRYLSGGNQQKVIVMR